MITNNHELFEYTRSLVTELQVSGHANYAHQLQKAMRASSMTTEVLGEIRIAAQTIVRECSDNHTQDEARKLIAYINRALNQ